MTLFPCYDAPAAAPRLRATIHMDVHRATLVEGQP
jgi:hypothetical protein